MKKLKLTTPGMYALVDDDIYPALANFNFNANWNKTSGWIVGWKANTENEKIYTIPLWRFILKADIRKPRCIFKNRNTLDFRKDNLLLVTKSHFNAWMGKMSGRETTSKYKGVSITPEGKWKVTVQNMYKTYNVGVFDNEEDAALAYNKKAIELWGEYVYQNVIEGDK